MRKGITTITVMAILVSLLFVGFGGTQVAADPGSMRGYWRLDTGISSEAVDSSDAINDGILSGGKFGNALEFDGVDDYVTVDPSDFQFGDGQPFTAECWIKTTQSYPDPIQILGIYSGSTYPTPNQFWMMSLQSGKAKFYLRVNDNAASTWIYSTTLVNDNTWHHVAVVKDTSNGLMRMYVDGTQEASSAFTDGETSNNHVLGVAGQHWNRYLNGRVDEIRISDTARYTTTSFTPQTSAFPDDENTIGLWHFDESVGTTAYDDSSNSNDGTINGATWAGPTWVSGKYGDALNFDGIDDYVNIPDDPTLDITGDITLEAWIWINGFDTSEGWHMYVMGKDSIGQRSYGISVDLGTYAGYHYITGGVPGFPAFIVFGGGTHKIVWGTGPLALNTWYHLAGVFDASTGDLKLYINGALESTTTSTLSSIYSGSADLRIGARQYSGHQCFFNGIIDEARIWDKPLTACQVNLAMEGKMEILPDAGLVIYESAFHDKNDGDPVTVCIISDYDITDVILKPNRGATPKKTDGWIESVSISPDKTSATFNVYQDSSKPCKTLHLWVYLSTDEHIGVNVHFM